MIRTLFIIAFLFVIGCGEKTVSPEEEGDSFSDLLFELSLQHLPDSIKTQLHSIQAWISFSEGTSFVDTLEELEGVWEGSLRIPDSDFSSDFGLYVFDEEGMVRAYYEKDLLNVSTAKVIRGVPWVPWQKDLVFQWLAQDPEDCVVYYSYAQKSLKGKVELKEGGEWKFLKGDTLKLPCEDKGKWQWDSLRVHFQEGLTRSWELESQYFLEPDSVEVLMTGEARLGDSLWFEVRLAGTPGGVDSVFWKWNHETKTHQGRDVKILLVPERGGALSIEWMVLSKNGKKYSQQTDVFVANPEAQIQVSFPDTLRALDSVKVVVSAFDAQGIDSIKCSIAGQPGSVQSLQGEDGAFWLVFEGVGNESIYLEVLDTHGGSTQKIFPVYVQKARWKFSGGDSLLFDRSLGLRGGFPYPPVTDSSNLAELMMVVDGDTLRVDVLDGSSGIPLPEVPWRHGQKLDFLYVNDQRDSLRLSMYYNSLQGLLQRTPTEKSHEEIEFALDAPLTSIPVGEWRLNLDEAVFVGNLFVLRVISSSTEVWGDLIVDQNAYVDRVGNLALYSLIRPREVVLKVKVPVFFATYE